MTSEFIFGNGGALQYMDLGKFDMVIALCSLYYMDDEDMVRVVEHVSNITNIFIVQCNTRRDIGRDDDHSYEKASVEYNMELLQQADFSTIKVVAPRDYTADINWQERWQRLIGCLAPMSLL